MDESASRSPDAPASACPLCGGTGFVVSTHEGRATARPCRCRVEERRRLRLESARIPPRYEHCTLESFAPTNESLERARGFANRVVDEFPGGEFGVLFCGRAGVGKTHLAVAILREVVRQRGAWGLFTEFTHLLRRIQDTYDRRSETPSWAVIQPALETDVLVLDDLGCTRTTPWVMETMGLILNERYNAKLLTLITTNRLESPPAGEESLADRIGERLASRLSEMCWTVRMDGEDYRRKIKSASFFA
jgi:DNA replication protein DnaC